MLTLAFSVIKLWMHLFHKLQCWLGLSSFHTVEDYGVVVFLKIFFLLLIILLVSGKLHYKSNNELWFPVAYPGVGGRNILKFSWCCLCFSSHSWMLGSEPPAAGDFCFFFQRNKLVSWHSLSSFATFKIWYVFRAFPLSSPWLCLWHCLSININWTTPWIGVKEWSPCRWKIFLISLFKESFFYRFFLVSEGDGRSASTPPSGYISGDFWKSRSGELQQ